MHLTLLVPELIWPEPADQFTLGKLAAPGFEWLIAHASAHHQASQAFETALAACCGNPKLPLAPLRRLGEGRFDQDADHWLCADPVHLRFHQERIILADAGAFDLEEDEARCIIASLNGEFSGIGEFHLGNARRWYLRLNSAVDHPVVPLSAIAGRRIDGDLPGKALPLTRWLNEVQMFLHGHPVNAQREATGKPAINSLWLWGGGCLSPPLPPLFSTLWSDNPLATGLALTSLTPHHAVPSHWEEFLPRAGQRPLLVLDHLLPGVLYENGEGWRTTFSALDNDWFLPIKQALGREIKHISLIAPCIYGELHYDIRAGERWKFWKKSSSLTALAERLAGPHKK